jgi:hypothetical protein
VLDLTGTPIPGATVTCDLAVPAAVTATGEVVPGELSTLTNGSGVWTFSVPANADLTPANTSYIITVHHTTLVSVSIVVTNAAYPGGHPTYFDIVTDGLIVSIPATPGNYVNGPPITQATTALAPAYVIGGIYYDLTLHKLRIGGATAWETVTSS